MRARPTLLVALAAALLTSAGPQGSAKTQALEKVVRAAFPGSTIERVTIDVDTEQRARIAKRSGGPFKKGIAFAYVARRAGKVIATVYFDRHRVRSKHEVLMIAVGPDAKIVEIRVLAFAEPRAYLPKPEWYGQFTGRALDDDLQLRHGIDGISGATLTARATTTAARRVLALHRIATGAGERRP